MHNACATFSVLVFVICECSCEVAQLGKGFAHRVRTLVFTTFKKMNWSSLFVRSNISLAAARDEMIFDFGHLGQLLQHLNFYEQRVTGHDGDGDLSGKGLPAMKATVIPRDSTKNRSLSGKGEPAMRATETPWVP